MAVELGTGYVSIVPSARGFASKLSNELSPAATAAGNDAGTKAGKAFSSRMGRSLSVVGGAFGHLDNVLASFGIPFTGALTKIGNKISDVETKGITGFQKLAVAGKAAALAVGVGVIAIGAESIHLADSFEASHARLEGAIKNTGGTYDEFAGRIGKVDKQLERVGFTNIETESSLATLTRAAGSTDKALGLMGLAADVARARHISLESAVAILSKVVTGHVALLGRYGIATKDAAGHTLSVDQAVAALSGRFGGQAAQSADTFQGRVQVLKAQLIDVGIKIGQFLIPYIEKLVGAISDVIGWFERHKVVAEALAVVLAGVVAAAMAAFIASLFTAGGALAFLLSPVALVVAALAAIVAAAIYVWTNWDQIWGWIQNHPAYAALIAILAAPIAAFVAIIGALKFLWDNWDQIWGWIKQAASDAWNAISGAASSAWGVISPVFAAIGAGVGAVVGAISFLQGVWASVWGGLGAVISAAFGVISGIIGGIIGAVNGAIGALHALGSALDAVSSAGDSFTAKDFIAEAKKKGIDIPGYASGGVVDLPLGQPTLAVVHGGEEVLTPAQRAAGGSGGINFNGPVSFGDKDVISDLEFWRLTRLVGA